jgi:hypothetical protein
LARCQIRRREGTKAFGFQSMGREGGLAIAASLRLDGKTSCRYVARYCELRCDRGMPGYNVVAFG